MRFAHAFAIAVGLVVFLAVKYLQPDLQAALLRASLDEFYNISVWPTAVTILVRPVLIVLPGFAAGLLVSTRGMLVGLTVGVVGGLLSQLLLSPEIAQTPPLFSYQWMTALALDISAGIFCAVGGAAGQLVRSYISLEHTRGQ
jgi:hypothetical protein